VRVSGHRCRSVTIRHGEIVGCSHIAHASVPKNLNSNEETPRGELAFNPVNVGWLSTAAATSIHWYVTVVLAQNHKSAVRIRCPHINNTEEEQVGMATLIITGGIMRISNHAGRQAAMTAVMASARGIREWNYFAPDKWDIARSVIHSQSTAHVGRHGNEEEGQSLSRQQLSQCEKIGGE